MPSADQLKPLQVRLPADVLSQFKDYSTNRLGQSMAATVLGWIEAALEGDAPPSSNHRPSAVARFERRHTRPARDQP